MTHPSLLDEHYYCADEFHRCDGGGEGLARRYNPALLPEPTTDEALVAPFPYFGGKRRVAAEVWRRFGDVPN